MNDGGDGDAFGYRFGRSNAGFIYYDHHGRQQFFLLWAETDHPDFRSADSLAFFPHDCTICDSNMGLLLCRRPPDTVPIRCIHPGQGKCRRRHRDYDRIRPHHAYFVCNPFLPNSERNIPIPPNWPHPNRIPRVVLIYMHPTHPCFIFQVVCALARSARTYVFDAYSSSTDAWTTSGPHILPGRVREETGVSTEHVAYWLLEDRASVIYYNAGDQTAGIIDLPRPYVALFLQPGVRLGSQLGRIRDELYFVAAKDHWRALYAYVDENENADNVDGWCCEDERTYAHPQLPMLSRFQDGRGQSPTRTNRVLVGAAAGCWR